MATMECSSALKMTRNPPQGGYQGGENSTSSQQSQYGAYNSREGQAYGRDVDAFKSHFDQPYGPVDTTSGNPLQPSAEGDRGVLGALAGGAAGAYGGHQMHHGFLGGIGGAVAGSMLEDAYKKHNKAEKKNKRRGSHCSHSSSSSDSGDDRKKRGATMAGNFSASSRGVHLEGATLVAECCNSQGHHHGSRLDLNDCFTNSDGRLGWARGGNFAASSRGMRLVNGGRELEAELGDGRGGWTANRVYLDERITNDDGRLHLLS
ncbi:hypothetical protein LTR32_004177 [Rachicladosporium monterosium]|uniref:Cyanovirin-N domain-containing protein n=1 Tax=Rachicladosporium monterosium TaxID=1507873 RepID=A0ABR0L5E3_9PEZI|nr:hypothetical protein LTR32_004177 [Rachicladosporium monterosium]